MCLGLGWRFLGHFVRVVSPPPSVVCVDILLSGRRRCRPPSRFERDIIRLWTHVVYSVSSHRRQSRSYHLSVSIFVAKGLVVLWAPGLVLGLRVIIFGPYQPISFYYPKGRTFSVQTTLHILDPFRLRYVLCLQRLCTGTPITVCTFVDRVFN